MRTLYRVGGSILIFCGVFIVLAAGLPQRADYTGTWQTGIGQVAPEIGAFAPVLEGTTLEGQMLNTWTLRGQPLLINFWATWCEPCRLEMPLLQTLHEDLPNLQIIAVNLGESPALVAEWVATYGLTFEVVLDTQRQLERLYQVRGQPATYIISPAGIIQHIFWGLAPEAALRSALAPYEETNQ